MKWSYKTLGGVDVWSAVLVSSLVLLGGGATHRWLGGFLTMEGSSPVVLERPLSSLGLHLGLWDGVDIPMNERVVETAGSDDYVYRHYAEKGSGETVDFYLSYIARPAKMLGHRPRACYPAQGWVHVGTETDHVVLATGAEIDCLLHRFEGNPQAGGGLVVLNYYVLRGRHTTEWTDFWGVKWRSPNLSRDPDFYVAQVQITRAVRSPALYDHAEEVVKRFAAEVAPRVDSLLPGTKTAEGG